MRLTDKEKKIARLALDKGAQPGERDSAATKLINSLQARGVTVEDIEKVIVREKVVVLKVASPAPQPTVVHKASPATPPPVKTASKPKSEPTEKGIPLWRKVAALSIVIIVLIFGFAQKAGQPVRASRSAQVSPSPEPTVPRAELVSFCLAFGISHRRQ